MNTQTENTISDTPDYTVVNGAIVLNEKSNELIDKYRMLKKKKLALGASYLGATVLQILIKAPWVQSFTLKAFPEWNYEEETGSYPLVSGKISNLIFVPGSYKKQMLSTQVTYTEMITREAQLDKVIQDVSSYDQIYLAVYRDFDDMYEGLSDDRDRHLAFHIDRSKVASLLESGNLSGKEAFKLLFPPRASELDMDTTN